MDVASILAWLESTSLATAIRESLYWFPMLEAVHVMGLALVFGTILVIDFRLLGLASTHRPFSRIAAETLKWTWVAFAITLITGALMFTTNAAVYFHNGPFRAKMLLLLLSGINMGIFEMNTGRNIQRWDKSPSAPAAGKAAAVISLLLWLSVIFLGRWIGFTTSRAVVDEPSQEQNFDNLFPGAPSEETPAPPTVPSGTK